MNTIIKLLLISLLLTSCNSTRIDFSEHGKNYIYRIKIPSGYKKQIDTDYHGKKAFYFFYNNSNNNKSVLYFTNNRSGLIKHEKSSKYGKGIYDTMYVSDSINIEGKYQNYFWREYKKNSIVIGFSNVDSMDLKKFNNIVEHQNLTK